MDLIKLAQIDLNKLNKNTGVLNPDVITDNPAQPISPTTSIGNIYQNIITYFLYGMGMLAVIVFIYAGIQYMTAGGDQEKAEKAKKTLIGAVIGIVLIAMSFAIYKTTLKALDKNVRPEEIMNSPL